jgi:tripartite-type tricarboxylate transporter receptor subunit TctC
MKQTRRTVLFTLAALAALAGQAKAPLYAQANYPTRPVRIILPFGAGGVADITARIVADKLGEKLGQRFIIENQPGAGGIAAARSVTSAAPDGYTIGMLTNGTAISVPLFKSLPFDPAKDFAPISTLGYFDFILATNASSPYKTLADVLDAAKKNPGKLNLGTINVGSSQNLSAELFKASAKVDLAIIPYRGSPEVIVSLLRDDVNVMIDNYAAMKATLGDGKIRALAATGTKRSQYLPDVPTVQEAGVPGYEVLSWNALFAPAKTPPAIIATLNKALNEILVTEDVKARLLELGIEAKASTPEELSERLRGDIAKWSQVIERAGIAKQ